MGMVCRWSKVNRLVAVQEWDELIAVKYAARAAGIVWHERVSAR